MPLSQSNDLIGSNGGVGAAVNTICAIITSLLSIVPIDLFGKCRTIRSHPVRHSFDLVSLPENGVDPDLLTPGHQNPSIVPPLQFTVPIVPQFWDILVVLVLSHVKAQFCEDREPRVLKHPNLGRFSLVPMGCGNPLSISDADDVARVTFRKVERRRNDCDGKGECREADNQWK